MRFFRGSTSRARFALACGSVIGALVGFGLFAWQPEEAAACGGFFKARDDSRKPSLSYEQVLIVYDEKAKQQHFIREVTFKDAETSFGFVVPTPSRPEVEKVGAPPFNKLRTAFTFTPSIGLGTIGHGGGAGTGQGFGSGAGSVTVLDKKKVGSFTAFVLAADDEEALSKWLKDNGLTSTPEADEWLAHYVRLKFFYVAMRYDPPKAQPKPEGIPVAEPSGLTPRPSRGVNAETVRISFPTPAPYYPYLEPKPPAKLPTLDRLLELWFVAPTEMSPVAVLDEGGKRSWVRPLQPGATHPNARDRLTTVLGEELAKLIPEGSVTVHTFQDQKFSRVGFGDILFVPKEKRPLDEAQKTALKPLLGLLDPSLVPAREETAK